MNLKHGFSPLADSPIACPHPTLTVKVCLAGGLNLARLDLAAGGEENAGHGRPVKQAP